MRLGRGNKYATDYTDTHARCCDCELMLPKENFSPDPQKNSGVMNRCGACLSLYRKKRAEELGRIYQGVRPESLKVKKDKTWYNDTHAECLEEGCGIHPKENFWAVSSNKRGVHAYCIKHAKADQNKRIKAKLEKMTPEEIEEKRLALWQKNNEDLILLTYKSYIRKRRESSERFGESPEVDMTLEEFTELWPKNNRCPHYHCYLETKPGGRTDSSPSIDRINNEKGYRKDNIEITSWGWNSDKGTMSVERQFAQGKAAALKLGYQWPPLPA